MAINIKYANNTIATLNQNGNIVAATAGYYCDDNISIECEDALFVPMPPNQRYEWLTRNMNYLPSITMSLMFSAQPYLIFKIKKIPSSLDKNKYTFEAHVEDDETHTSCIQSIEIYSDTEIRVNYGANFAKDFIKQIVLSIYYDGNLVGQGKLSYGGYISNVWNQSDLQTQTLLRSFWSYGLAANERFSD